LLKTWSTLSDTDYDAFVVTLRGCRKGNELLKKSWILFWWGASCANCKVSLVPACDL
jgi:hypothetical protein